MNIKRKITALVAFLALTGAVQCIGGLATFSSVRDWYPTLEKVSWNPPAWVFGPVWTALYIMIAISGWRIWMALNTHQLQHPALRWYAIQLILNLLWSILFFGLRSPASGLLCILFLTAAIIVTIKKFLPIDKPAALLFVPYLLWVAYAITLNAGIVYLN